MSPARSLGTVAQTPPTGCLWGPRRAAVLNETASASNIEIGVLASQIIASRRAIRSAETWFESRLRTFRTAIEAELLRHSVIADGCYIYTRHTLKPGRAACAGATLWTDMTTLSERNRSAAQPRPNKKMARDVRPRRSQFRKTEPAGIRHQARAPQDAQRNYERYLALARAEALTGDPIAAENYFQHAEHYFRSMQQSSS